MVVIPSLLIEPSRPSACLRYGAFRKCIHQLCMMGKVIDDYDDDDDDDEYLS